MASPVHKVLYHTAYNQGIDNRPVCSSENITGFCGANDLIARLVIIVRGKKLSALGTGF